MITDNYTAMGETSEAAIITPKRVDQLMREHGVPLDVADEFYEIHGICTTYDAADVLSFLGY